MSKVKAGGTAKNLSDSKPKFLGIKLADGQKAQVGSIIVRQRGTKIVAGDNVKMGKDHTLFSKKVGKVKFTSKRHKNYNGQTTIKKVASVN